MKITDALLGEHAMLYALFNEIERQFSKDRSIQELQILVDVLENQLGTHSEIEDNHLFPALMTTLGAPDSLVVMTTEHEEIGKCLAAAKNETDIDRLKSQIYELINLAKIHFQKEELVLFAVVQETLNEEQQLALGSVWGIERGVIVDSNKNPCRAAV